MKRVRNAWKRNAAGYFFLSPWLIGFFGLTLIPMAASLYLSFTDYNMLNLPKWTGFSNYARMFHDRNYLDSVKVTLKYVLIGVPIHLLIALLIAMALNRGIKGLGIYRAVYYVPSLFGGSVAVSLLWQKIFGENGLINMVLSLFGMKGHNWVNSPETALYTLVLLSIWQFGSPMIIFIAGLKQIPTDYYEAAKIDGAERGKQFLYITLPLLTPILFFNLVMGIISAFQAFTPAYIVSGGSGGPLNATLFYTLYLYQQGFTNFNMGYASAMAWILLLTVAVVTGFLFRSSSKWVHYAE